jgi:thiamine-phosphate pyrophosphorylase
LLPWVYPIIDTVSLERRGYSARAFAVALIAGGARLLQYRHKGEFTRARFAELEDIAHACHQAGVQLVVNDRADLAALVNAGVHVGQEDLDPLHVRRIIGARMLGYSTHNELQFTHPDTEAADYIAFGPIFTTGSKQSPDPEVGLATLARLRPMTTRPVVAIGGITRATAQAVWRAGADSIAVIADLLPGTLTHESIRKRIEEWNQLPR